MSRRSWWPRWPWNTPETLGEIITYGFVAEPVAWQIVTCWPAIFSSDLLCSSDLMCSSDLDLLCSSDLMCSSVFCLCSSCFPEDFDEVPEPHFEPLFFSACTSTSWGPQFVLCGWLLPGPCSVSLPWPAEVAIWPAVLPLPYCFVLSDDAVA